MVERGFCCDRDTVRLVPRLLLLSSGAVVPPDKSGWRNDAITAGGMQLIVNGPDYDILYTDSSGGSRVSVPKAFKLSQFPSQIPTTYSSSLYIGERPHFSTGYSASIVLGAAKLFGVFPEVATSSRKVHSSRAIA